MKGSFGNNINSLNISNINAKTASYSKIPSESSLIKKEVKTHSHIKTALSEDKDKDKITKLKQNSNNKNRSRSHLNTEENDINNKAYYLSGEVPFRDKYIVEIKYLKTDININKEKEKSSKKKYINSNNLLNDIIDEKKNKIYK